MLLLYSIIAVALLLCPLSACKGGHVHNTFEIGNDTVHLPTPPELLMHQTERGIIRNLTTGYLDEESVMGITLPASTIPIYSIVPLSIYIDPTEAIGGWKVDVIYPSERLTPSNVSLGGWWTNATFSSIGNMSIPGIIRGVQACCNSNYTYPAINHTGFIMEFEAIAPGVCEIMLTNVTLTNSSFTVLPVTTRNTSFSINQYPSALNDTVATQEDMSLRIDVLDNDYDLEDGRPSFEDITVFPTHGIVEVNTDESVEYEPQGNFFGNDMFQYRVVDSGGLQATAWVFITIESVNDLPVVTDIPDQTIFEGGSFAPINLDDFVTDIEDTDENIEWTYSGNTHLTISITDRIATITPPTPDWFGSEIITFTAVDTGGLTAFDSATFTVNPVNDPPQANFSYAPLFPFVHDMIHFTDLSTDIDGTLASWNWDFDDGNGSTLQNPVHSYNDAGQYLVTLNVTDNTSAYHSISREVVVQQKPEHPPIVTKIIPADAAVSIVRPPDNITVTIEDPDGDSMDLVIRSMRYSEGYITEWYELATFENAGNGSYEVVPMGNDWIWGNTVYHWGINLTDGTFWVNNTYTFTTGGSRYDVNNDDTVNFVDAGIVWVHRTTNAVYDGLYDVNGDGTVNFIDAGRTWVQRD